MGKKQKTNPRKCSSLWLKERMNTISKNRYVRSVSNMC